MSSDADLIKLYSQRILALAAEITNDTRLDTPLVSVIKRAPLCGSSVTVDLDIDCPSYTSDAADDLLRVDLGGRRIIKKKTKNTN